MNGNNTRLQFSMTIKFWFSTFYKIPLKIWIFEIESSKSVWGIIISSSQHLFNATFTMKKIGIPQ